MERTTDMNMIPSDGSDGAQQYISAIIGAWPIFVFSGGAAFFFGLRRIKSGFKQRTFLQIFGNLILQTITCGCIGGGAAMLAPVFISTITPEIQLGIALFFGVFGTGAVATFMRAKFGLKIVDLMDADDMNAIRDAMPEREKGEIDKPENE